MWISHVFKRGEGCLFTVLIKTISGSLMQPTKYDLGSLLGSHLHVKQLHSSPNTYV